MFGMNIGFLNPYFSSFDTPLFFSLPKLLNLRFDLSIDFDSFDIRHDIINFNYGSLMLWATHVYSHDYFGDSCL